MIVRRMGEVALGLFFHLFLYKWWLIHAVAKINKPVDLISLKN